MTDRMGQRLRLTPRLSRKAILTAIAFCILISSRLFAQTSDSGRPSQAGDHALLPGQGFEVVAIKSAENGPKTPRFLTLQGTNRFVVRDYNLKLLIAAAYDMNPGTISGGPAWIESDHFDILALTPGQTKPDHNAQMAMLRKLLQDRFHLTFHREEKEFSIYTLEVAKDGPKLKPTTLSPDAPASVGPGMVYPQKIVMPASNATMNDFASLLQRAVLDRPVVDKTGLTGRYDFSLEWAPDERQFGGELPAAPDDAPSLPFFEAVRQQLGLQLEARKGPISAIVVDQVEHPSPN
ncbi:TIGR03435 family protein [Silvibacterium sp.]|uniref:TIGR03435 family protein n=1 Tax=Silvibacterium sp. TaxID=1964179 RepID=UPI0039E46C9C